MSRPQNSYQTLLRTPSQPIRTPGDKQDPEIKSNSNVRIQGIIENEIVKLHEWITKQFLSPTLNTKIAK